MAAAAVTASAVPSGDEEGHSHQNETDCSHSALTKAGKVGS